MKRVVRELVRVVVFLTPLVWGGGEAAAEKRLGAVFGAEGIEELNWDGADIVNDGTPHVSRIILEKTWRGGDGINQYDFEQAGLTDPQTGFNRENSVLTYGYRWGAVLFTYGVEDDRLELTTTIRNTSERTIAMFDITPFSLSLPQPVDVPKRWRGSVDLPGRFNVVEASYTERHKLVRITSDGIPLPARRANEATLWSRPSNKRNEAGAGIPRAECARIYVALYKLQRICDAGGGPKHPGEAAY